MSTMKVQTSHKINGWPQWKTHPDCDNVTVQEDGFCNECQQSHYVYIDGLWGPYTSFYTPEEWKNRKNGSSNTVRLSDLPVKEQDIIKRDRHLEAHPEDQVLYDFTMEYAREVVQSLKLDHVYFDFKRGSRSTVYYRPSWNHDFENEMWFGWQSIRNAFDLGFVEYASLQELLTSSVPDWQKLRGPDAVRLVVLHEVAHLLTYDRYQSKGNPHGSHFQACYEEVLSLFAFGKAWSKVG